MSATNFRLHWLFFLSRERDKERRLGLGIGITRKETCTRLKQKSNTVDDKNDNHERLTKISRGKNKNDNIAYVLRDTYLDLSLVETFSST